MHLHFHKAHPQVIKPRACNDHPLRNDPPQVIKPLVALARSSVCDALVRLGAADDQGQAYAAAATVFVSHAWRYTFAQLMEAVSAFAAAQPEPAKVYVWLVSAVRLCPRKRRLPLPPELP